MFWGIEQRRQISHRRRIDVMFVTVSGFIQFCLIFCASGFYRCSFSLFLNYCFVVFSRFLLSLFAISLPFCVYLPSTNNLSVFPRTLFFFYLTSPSAAHYSPHVSLILIFFKMLDSGLLGVLLYFLPWQRFIILILL